MATRSMKQLVVFDYAERRERIIKLNAQRSILSVTRNGMRPYLLDVQLGNGQIESVYQIKEYDEHGTPRWVPFGNPATLEDRERLLQYMDQAWPRLLESPLEQRGQCGPIT